jgi:serine/threonine-protein kinase
MPDPLEHLRAVLADRYELGEEIGRGGMAVVYGAEDLRHHRQVAIKVLHPELAAALGSDRFSREIEFAARLSHPHIVPLYDSGETDGVLYYVMPLLTEGSLRSTLDREKQLGLEETARIVSEVAAALDHAHEAGVIHRDIKPANIMFSGGEAVVADFGVATAVAAAGSDTLTATGLAIGTPAYMSPEQSAGVHDVDGRSDVFALGCVAYEALAGAPPFDGPTPQAIQARKTAGEVQGLRVVRDTVPHAAARRQQIDTAPRAISPPPWPRPFEPRRGKRIRPWRQPSRRAGERQRSSQQRPWLLPHWPYGTSAWAASRAPSDPPPPASSRSGTALWSAISTTRRTIRVSAWR